MNYENRKDIKEFYRVTAIGYDHCLYEIEDFVTKEEAIERAKELISSNGRHTCKIGRFFHDDENRLYGDARYNCYVKQEGLAW